MAKRTKNESKTTDMAGATTTRHRIGKLKTASDVQKYIARCIKKAELEGEGGTNKYYKLVMMSSILLKAIDSSEIDKRIQALEEKVLKGES